MLTKLTGVFDADQVRQIREALLRANWVDGRATAGHQALRAKQNLQLAQDDPLAKRVGDLILDALAVQPRFIAAALPLRVLPPRFNRYEGGGQYGEHVDGSVMSLPGTSQRIRTDISATLFLSDPDDYDGGELVISDTFGDRSVKLAAGDMVLYPGTSVHKVMPVTRGVRLAAFFWIQSLVRDDGQRSLLLELDEAIQHLSVQVPESPQLARLTGVYHNLLRRWSDT